MVDHSMQRTLVAAGEVGAAVVTVALSLAVTYRWFAPRVLGSDMREELLRGNIASGIVLGALLTSPTLVVLSTLGPIIYHVRAHFLLGDRPGSEAAVLMIVAIGYVAVVLGLALAAVWLALRIFALLTRGIDEMSEVRRGNVAVAIVLAAVIAVVGMFTQVGISALAGSLIPQTPLGEVKVMP